MTAGLRQRAWLNRGPIVALALYVSFVTLIVAVRPEVVRHGGPPCPFRSLTGLPCPTCGTTRMLQAAWDGQWQEAFLHNPLMFVLVASGPLAALLMLLAPAWFAKLQFIGRGAAYALITALAANWAFLLWRQIVCTGQTW